MASCITDQWATGSPQAKLEVTQSSSTGDKSTLSYKLYYIANSPAKSATADRDYAITINGNTVKTGSFNINEKKGTHKVTSGTVNINKTTSAQNISFKVEFEFKLTWSGTYGGWKSKSGSISIPAKTKYTVSYNANGGSGAPTSQTKWYGTSLKLSSTQPKKPGSTFVNWNTESDGSGASYASEAMYTKNANETLYAIWSTKAYAVIYDLNGGSGTFDNQTKRHGVNLTLRTGKPTRTGYIFKGWALTKTGSVCYQPGGTYNKNENLTLYAVWNEAYTITYNLKGGSGTFNSQTKEKGVHITLHTGSPTKNGYIFKGWALSDGGSVYYQPGGQCGRNENLTLYAVWAADYLKPRISNKSVYRSNSSGSEDDNGTYAKVIFDWVCDYIVSSIKIEWKKTIETSYEEVNSRTISATGNNGKVDTTIGSGSLSTDSTYDIRISVSDSGGTTTSTLSLGGVKYIIDVLTGGAGLAFGKPAEKDNTIEFGMKMWSKYGHIMPTPKSLDTNEDLNNLKNYGYYILPTTTISNTILNKPELSTTATGFLEVIPGGNGIQVIQRLTQCHKNEQYIWQRCYYYDSALKTDTWGNWQMLCSGTHNYTFTKASSTTINRYTLSRSGDVVTMYVNCKWASAVSAENNVELGTIPLTIKPVDSVATAGLVGSTGTCAAWVKNDGTVRFRPIGAYTAGTAIEFNLVWNVTATFTY